MNKSNSFLIGGILVLILVLGGVGVYFIMQSSDEEEQQESTTTTIKQPSNGTIEQTEFTLNDVALHDSRDDCWMVIEGFVYDVTDFIVSHPGGNALLEGCGIDATELFETRPMGSGTEHSSSAHTMLNDYEIGTLAE
jgi:cytochrome b involved in lipid metabolism